MNRERLQLPAFILVVGMCIFGFWQVDKVQDAAEADRANAKVSACVQYNASLAQVRVAVKSSLLALAPQDVPLTPRQQATIDLYNSAVDNGLPYRDCSAAGIASFYKNPPVDPATKK